MTSSASPYDNLLQSYQSKSKIILYEGKLYFYYNNWGPSAKIWEEVVLALEKKIEWVPKNKVILPCFGKGKREIFELGMRENSTFLIKLHYHCCSQIS